MQIITKYDIGDNVFFLWGNKLCSSKIDGFQYCGQNKLMYKIYCDGTVKWFFEDELFKEVDHLFYNLKENITNYTIIE